MIGRHPLFICNVKNQNLKVLTRHQNYVSIDSEFGIKT